MTLEVKTPIGCDDDQVCERPEHTLQCPNTFKKGDDVFNVVSNLAGEFFACLSPDLSFGQGSAGGNNFAEQLNALDPGDYVLKWVVPEEGPCPEVSTTCSVTVEPQFVEPVLGCPVSSTWTADEGQSYSITHDITEPEGKVQVIVGGATLVTIQNVASLPQPLNFGPLLDQLFDNEDIAEDDIVTIRFCYEGTDVSSECTLTVAVGGSGENNAPEKGDLDLSTLPEVVPGQPWSYDMSQHFSDPDGDVLTYLLDNTAAPFLSIDSATGVVSGTVPATATSPLFFVVRAQDPSGELSGVCIVTLNFDVDPSCDGSLVTVVPENFCFSDAANVDGYTFPVGANTSGNIGTVRACYVATTATATIDDALFNMSAFNANPTLVDIYDDLYAALDSNDLLTTGTSLFYICESDPGDGCPVIRHVSSFTLQQCLPSEILLQEFNWTFADNGDGTSTAQLDLSTLVDLQGRDLNINNTDSDYAGTLTESNGLLTWVYPNGSACMNSSMVFDVPPPNPNPCGCPASKVTLETHARTEGTDCLILSDSGIPVPAGSKIPIVGIGGGEPRVDSSATPGISGTPLEAWLGEVQDEWPPTGLPPWEQALDGNGVPIPNTWVRYWSLPGFDGFETLEFDENNPQLGATYQAQLYDGTTGDPVGSFEAFIDSYEGQPLSCDNAYTDTQLTQDGSPIQVAFCFDNVKASGWDEGEPFDSAPDGAVDWVVRNLRACVQFQTV